MKEKMRVCIGFGQDSHAFDEGNLEKKCVIGGVIIEDSPPFAADSDGDIILHAMCNAITSLTHIPILGGVAIELCKSGITDSRIYLEEALQTLSSQKIQHVSLSIEGKRPRLQSRCDQIRTKVAEILSIQANQVGLTITSGDGLTAFGRGEGMQCICLITAIKD